MSQIASVLAALDYYELATAIRRRLSRHGRGNGERSVHKLPDGPDDFSATDGMPIRLRSLVSSGRAVLIIAVSTVGASANDNLVQLNFGLETTDSSTGEEFILEAVRLIMTPRSLKTLQLSLGGLVQTIESFMGEEIPVGVVSQPAVRQKGEP